jgi:hypothetical protein
MHENVQGQLRAIITLIHGGNDLSHVAGNSGYARQTRFYVKRVVQSFSVSAVMWRYHPEEPGLTVTEEGLNDSLKSSAAEASHLLLFVV